MKSRYCLDHVLIHGFGQTGRSVLAFLTPKAKKISVLCEPSSIERHQMRCIDHPNVSVYPDNPLPTLINNVSLIIKSPGILPTHPLYAQPNPFHCPVISDIELFADMAKAPIIAVTGTNGKSTVVHLIAKLLQTLGQSVCLGGNVGVPAMTLLNQPIPDYYLLEISSFQLHHTYHLNAKVGVLLNIAPDHLHWHGGMENYVNAKLRLLCQSDCVVLPKHLSVSKSHVYVSHNKPGKETFGIATFHGNDYLALDNKKIMALKALSATLQQPHNVLNTLSALGVLYALHLPLSPALSALTQFQGLPHRLEPLQTAHSTRWFNDSKATNLSASIAAIEGISEQYAKKVIWLGGGILKTADYAPLLNAVAKHVKACLVFGQDGPLLYRALHNSVLTTVCQTLEHAVTAAKTLAQDDDIILFSPGGASFDAFAHFEARGDAFVQCVQRLGYPKKK